VLKYGKYFAYNETMRYKQGTEMVRRW